MLLLAGGTSRNSIYRASQLGQSLSGRKNVTFFVSLLPGTDDELNEEEAEAIEKEEEVKEGEPSVQRAPRRVKKFRVVIGTPVLDRPGWAKLIQNGQKMLQKGETFLADGVYWVSWL